MSVTGTGGGGGLRNGGGGVGGAGDFGRDDVLARREVGVRGLLGDQRPGVS